MASMCLSPFPSRSTRRSARYSSTVRVDKGRLSLHHGEGGYVNERMHDGEQHVLNSPFSAFGVQPLQEGPRQVQNKE